MSNNLNLDRLEELLETQDPAEIRAHYAEALAANPECAAMLDAFEALDDYFATLKAADPVPEVTPLTQLPPVDEAVPAPTVVRPMRPKPKRRPIIMRFMPLAAVLVAALLIGRLVLPEAQEQAAHVASPEAVLEDGNPEPPEEKEGFFNWLRDKVQLNYEKGKSTSYDKAIKEAPTQSALDDTVAAEPIAMAEEEESTVDATDMEAFVQPPPEAKPPATPAPPVFEVSHEMAQDQDPLERQRRASPKKAKAPEPLRAPNTGKRERGQEPATLELRRTETQEGTRSYVGVTEQGNLTLESPAQEPRRITGFATAATLWMTTFQSWRVNLAKRSDVFVDGLKLPESIDRLNEMVYIQTLDENLYLFQAVDPERKGPIQLEVRLNSERRCTAIRILN